MYVYIYKTCLLGVFSGNIKCHASVVFFYFLPSPLFCGTRCNVSVSCPQLHFMTWHDLHISWLGHMFVYICMYTYTVLSCNSGCTFSYLLWLFLYRVFAWRLLEGKRNVKFGCKGAMYIHRSQRCYTTCMFSWPVLKRKLTLYSFIWSAGFIKSFFVFFY